MKYFISYTTRDSELTLDLLDSFSRRLKARGEVFVDLLHNNSEDRQKRVIAELDASDMLLVIETKSTYQSEWVNFEISRAKSRRIPIRKLSLEEIIFFFPHNGPF